MTRIEPLGDSQCEGAYQSGIGKVGHDDSRLQGIDITVWQIAIDALRTVVSDPAQQSLGLQHAAANDDAMGG